MCRPHLLMSHGIPCGRQLLLQLLQLPAAVLLPGLPPSENIQVGQRGGRHQPVCAAAEQQGQAARRLLGRRLDAGQAVAATRLTGQEKADQAAAQEGGRHRRAWATRAGPVVRAVRQAATVAAAATAVTEGGRSSCARPSACPPSL